MYLLRRTKHHRLPASQPFLNPQKTQNQHTSRDPQKLTSASLRAALRFRSVRCSPSRGTTGEAGSQRPPPRPAGCRGPTGEGASRRRYRSAVTSPVRRGRAA